ncbi:Uncharacterised protein [Leclercia adecarboxylata]|uniref:Uncharacterized protein n=1 Tax=Leclercia adecarboxylata TaxID=83655 RepID=A0A4U9HU08_9ENTR|nr:Uncharacterised protein [Leclercia adecarboxylata]
MPVYREEMMLVVPAGHTKGRAGNGTSAGAISMLFAPTAPIAANFESWFHADRATPGAHS